MAKQKSKYKENRPDPKFHSLLLARFTNYLMRCGKKEKAQTILYRALDIVKKKTKKDPVEIFDQAIENTGPLLEVKTKRIGGANYQIPQEVGRDRRLILAMRWLIEGAKARKGAAMSQRLAREILSAVKDEGYAVKKKEEAHRMAEANRAFAHYAKF
jgi:small subunit ribosomal protein S7